VPLYEYECEACGQRFEKIQKFSDPPLEACARCGQGPVRKLLSSPAIQFKGSGWYITDYANKGKGDAAAAAKAGSGAAGETAAGAGADAKSEATGAAAPATPAPAAAAPTPSKKE
jgi:putative FmdB family regulatory protein